MESHSLLSSSFDKHIAMTDIRMSHLPVFSTAVHWSHSSERLVICSGLFCRLAPCTILLLIRHSVPRSTPQSRFSVAPMLLPQWVCDLGHFQIFNCVCAECNYRRTLTSTSYWSREVPTMRVFKSRWRRDAFAVSWQKVLHCPVSIMRIFELGVRCAVRVLD